MPLPARLHSRRQIVGLLLVGLAIGSPLGAHAAETNVAVAANFTDAAKLIAAAFEAKTGHKATLSFGATGALTTQIVQGAPFQILLSADQAAPKKLADDGHAVAHSLFTYAIGKLVLFSMNAALIKGEQTLKDGKFNKIAIANPTTAPYGAAAIETMKALGVNDALTPKVVQGGNITQTFQFVETGNAELGFVALSQVVERTGGSRWVVAQNYYTPIRQDAVLLKTGASNPAATAFIEFLKGAEAATIAEKFGYAVR